MKTNWSTKKLEDLVEFQNGLWTGKKASFVTAKVLRNTNFKNGDGSLNYDDVAEIQVEEKQLGKRTLTKGDILLERSGGGPTQPVGRVVYFDKDEKYSFSNFTTRIRINSEDLDSKFLWFFLHSFYKSGKTELMQKKTTGIRNLTFSEYKQIEIPLPPLEVQKKIVVKLESVLAKISEVKKLRAEARENADTLLSAELHKIFEEGKKKGWEEKKVEQVVVEVKSGFACAKKNEVSDGIVHLRTHNIDTGGNLNFDKIVKIPEKFVDQEVFELQEGDILFNNTNSTELVGKTALVTKDLPYAFSNHLTRMRVDKEVILPEWMVYVFHTYWRDKFFESICNRWVGQSGINQTMLKDIAIPIPSLAEQKKIVARLDTISQKVGAVKELQSKTENEFSTLKNSVLSKAFTGEMV